MSQLLGPLSALMSSITWSIGSATYAHLAKKTPAHVINFNRAAIAFPICIIGIFITYGSFESGLAEFTKASPSHITWLFISVIGSYAFADVLFLWSTVALGVPGALAISAIYPIWSAFAGYFFEDQKLSLVQSGGLLSVIGGLIIVILSGRPKSREQTSQRAYFKGVLLALATSLLWSLNTFAIMRGGAEISALVGNSFRMFFALALCPLVAFFMGQKGALTMEKKSYKKFGWIFALEAVGGSTFFMYALTHSSLAVASALSSLAPVISVPIAWIAGKENVSILKTLGILIVVIGVILLVQ